MYKEEIKTYLSPDDVTVYLENTRESTTRNKIQ